MTTLFTAADDWLDAIHRAFQEESDRAAAIVVAAMLDDALKSLLSRRLLQPMAKDRSLLDGDQAPLGTFSARIDAAHQLGLISRWMARDLHLVRKIRNEFAHSPFTLTFESDVVLNRVRALEEASDYNRRYPPTRAAIGPPGPRWDFLGISAWILYSLHREEVDRVPDHGPEFGYVEWDAVLPEEVRQRLRGEEAT